MTRVRGPEPPRAIDWSVGRKESMSKMTIKIRKRIKNKVKIKSKSTTHSLSPNLNRARNPLPNPTLHLSSQARCPGASLLHSREQSQLLESRP
jgi:hypothetical protein